MKAEMLLNPDDVAPLASDFYRRVLSTLRAADIPFLVGGGYAFYSYTTIARDTKDIDLFVLPTDAQQALDVLAEAGYATELKYPHWLGKIFHEGYFVDIIFGSGNGLCNVDSQWFEFALPAKILGEVVQLTPVEEMIWQKAYIMERHRFDGSDIAHLLHYHSESLDWDRLLRRFNSLWPVLLSHLLLYRFVYPDDYSPSAIAALRTLTARLQNDVDNAQQVADVRPPLCRGTMLSLLDYLPAVQKWGFRDARLPPSGKMTSAEIDHWTNNFER